MSFHKTCKNNSTRVNQGDIFKNISFIEKYTEIAGEFEIKILDFPYVYILTQDCDLEQNKNERNKIDQNLCSKRDKYLISVLAAPIYNAQHVFEGNHLSNIEIDSEKCNSDRKKKIKKNQEQRYHYIEFASDIELSSSIIDFKHYFSITLESLEENMNKRICQIEPLYRESISQRFSYYLSRIGLPNIEKCEE